jgi:hypothetical protein
MARQIADKAAIKAIVENYKFCSAYTCRINSAPDGQDVRVVSLAFGNASPMVEIIGMKPPKAGEELRGYLCALFRTAGIAVVNSGCEQNKTALRKGVLIQPNTVNICLTVPSSSGARTIEFCNALVAAKHNIA